MSSHNCISNEYMCSKAGRRLPPPLLLCLLIWIVWPALPALSDEQPYVVPEIKVHRIQSRFVDQEFEIRVAVPITLADGGERFPVMFSRPSQRAAMRNTFSILATLNLNGEVLRSPLPPMTPSG